jgi:hypothetical protein
MGKSGLDALKPSEFFRRRRDAAKAKAAREAAPEPPFDPERTMMTGPGVVRPQSAVSVPAPPSSRPLRPAPAAAVPFDPERTVMAPNPAFHPTRAAAEAAHAQEAPAPAFDGNRTMAVGRHLPLAHREAPARPAAVAPVPPVAPVNPPEPAASVPFDGDRTLPLASLTREEAPVRR